MIQTLQDNTPRSTQIRANTYQSILRDVCNTIGRFAACIQKAGKVLLFNYSAITKATSMEPRGILIGWLQSNDTICYLLQTHAVAEI